MEKYLDDRFIFWTCPWVDIWELLLQILHLKITFTTKHSFIELPFLDILIKNENSQIIECIHRKHTCNQQYLHFNSHRSKNCIRFLP